MTRAPRDAGQDMVVGVPLVSAMSGATGGTQVRRWEGLEVVEVARAKARPEGEPQPGAARPWRRARCRLATPRAAMSRRRADSPRAATRRRRVADARGLRPRIPPGAPWSARHGTQARRPVPRHESAGARALLFRAPRGARSRAQAPALVRQSPPARRSAIGQHAEDASGASTECTPAPHICKRHNCPRAPESPRLPTRPAPHLTANSSRG